MVYINNGKGNYLIVCNKSVVLTSSHLNCIDINTPYFKLSFVANEFFFFSGQLVEGIKSSAWELPIDCCDKALILVLKKLMNLL